MQCVTLFPLTDFSQYSFIFFIIIIILLLLLLLLLLLFRLKMVNMMEGGLTPMMTDQQLGQIGFQMILHPMTGLYAASKAMATAYGHLHKEGSIQDVLGLLHSMQVRSR